MTILPHRRFSASAVPIADAWYADPFCTSDLKVTGAYSTTADGACPVVLPSGNMAYVKPRPDADKKLVVAREKIAADLAHLIGVPVAPVAVKMPDPANGWDYHSAISLVCLEGGRLWQDGGRTHLQDAAEALEALRVFWTWIGDYDHNDHGANLLYEVASTGCAVVAIDHSYSLCHANGVDPLATGHSNGYGTKGLATADAACRDTVAAIQGVDKARVEELVRRLDGLLNMDEHNRIIGILEARRDKLPGMLGL